jgi:FtsP/CotA-like multicopper oxidase with cupredoxin domain
MQHHQRDPVTPADSFPTDPAGLPKASQPQLLELADGDTLELRVGPVAKPLGDTTVRMLGYNGSIPGSTVKVAEGTEIVVHVENHGDLDTTVHWHGLRLENRYESPTRPSTDPGGWGVLPTASSSRTQACTAPPHIREDYTQELGLRQHPGPLPTRPPAAGPRPDPDPDDFLSRTASPLQPH